MKLKSFATSLVALVLGAGSAPGQVNSLTDDVSRLVAAAKLGSARVGVSIRDVDSGVVLADYNFETPSTSLLTNKDTKAFEPAWDDEIVKGALVTKAGALPDCRPWRVPRGGDSRMRATPDAGRQTRHLQ
mgnify:CR=1 FL=1